MYDSKIGIVNLVFEADQGTVDLENETQRSKLSVIKPVSRCRFHRRQTNTSLSIFKT